MRSTRPQSNPSLARVIEELESWGVRDYRTVPECSSVRVIWRQPGKPERSIKVHPAKAGISRKHSIPRRIVRDILARDNQ